MHLGHMQPHQRAETVAQPKLLQPEFSPGIGDVMCCGYYGRINNRLGSTKLVAHKPPGAGSSVLSSSGRSTKVGTVACVDSHQIMPEVSYINRHGGMHSRAFYKQTMSLLLWADHHLLSIRAAHIPGCLNRGVDMLLRGGASRGSTRGVEATAVRIVWDCLVVESENYLFTTSKNVHCLLL